MKKFGKILGYLAIILIVVIIVTITYIKNALPSVELNNEFKAELTDQNLKRGEYLVNSVTACFHCHSDVDFSKFSGKIVENTEGQGGRFYPEGGGFPGNFYASNITPHNLGDWTDAEIYRSITSGISKNGEPLFPLMPYYSYRYLTEDDAKSIVAYLRTLSPIKADYEKSEFSFPFSLILRTIPDVAAPSEIDRSNSVEYGKYLATIAGCESCHSPSEGGSKIEGMEYSGGFEIPMETGGSCVAANITQDVETGIGSWSKEKFIERFKYYENNDSLNVNHGEFNSEMPWRIYAGMTEEDLGAIYDFLKTVKPVKNKVNKFSL